MKLLFFLLLWILCVTTVGLQPLLTSWKHSLPNCCSGAERRAPLPHCSSSAERTAPLQHIYFGPLAATWPRSRAAYLGTFERLTAREGWPKREWSMAAKVHNFCQWSPLCQRTSTNKLAPALLIPLPHHWGSLRAGGHGPSRTAPKVRLRPWAHASTGQLCHQVPRGCPTP